MIGAGDYRWQYAYFPCSRTSDGTTGDKPRVWGTSPYTNGMGSPTATYWGSEELQSSQQENEYGAVRTRWYGTIRLRNVLTISAEDRLIGGALSTTLYIIDGVRIDHPNNQTVLDVHSLN
jgi:hypothetical protein